MRPPALQRLFSIDHTRQEGAHECVKMHITLTHTADAAPDGQLQAGDRGSEAVRNCWRTLAGILWLMHSCPFVFSPPPPLDARMLDGILEGLDCASEDALVPLLDCLRSELQGQLC